MRYSPLAPEPDGPRRILPLPRGVAPADVVGCQRCLDARTLLMRLDGGRLVCWRCWDELGRPWPQAVCSIEQVHLAELRTRERMQKRGGNAAYVVRSGKS